MTPRRGTLYAVSRNGEVWSNHDTLDQARKVAEGVARGTRKFELYQGFDADGRSAVVERPVRVRVEELRACLEPGRWDLIAYHHEWLAGEEVTP